MYKYHDKKPKKPGRVSEPVQVYLAQDDRASLQRLAQQLGVSMSDVIRRAIGVLEEHTMNPGNHPALRLIGAVDTPEQGIAYDAAVEHDRYLAEMADPPPAAPARKRRGR